MTGFLVNLLSPVFSSLGVSQADLTSYIEKLIGYVIAIFALLVVMIVVMVVAHKAKKGFRQESSTCTRDYRPEPCNHSEGC